MLLVAVKSCHRDRKAGLHDAIRGTWGKDLGKKNVMLRFFMGANPDTREGTPLRNDEVVLDCDDTYAALPHKTRGICQWTMSKIIHNVFLCDCDTFVIAKELLALPFELPDYAGSFKNGEEEIGQTFHYQDHMGDYPNCYTWASGGFGYFLSIKAAQEIAESFPQVWAEDMYVGQVLGPEIAKGWMMAMALDMAGKATYHFRKSPKFPEFTPELLYRMYRDGGPENIYREAINAL